MPSGPRAALEPVDLRSSAWTRHVSGTKGHRAPTQEPDVRHASLATTINSNCLPTPTLPRGYVGCVLEVLPCSLRRASVSKVVVHTVSLFLHISMYRDVSRCFSLCILSWRFLSAFATVQWSRFFSTDHGCPRSRSVRLVGRSHAGRSR